MRTLKFKKNHTLEYKDGRCVLCHAGLTLEVPEDEAEELLKLGVADKVGTQSGNERLSVNRVEIYEKKFSRSQLRGLCNEYKIPYKASTHRNKEDYIQSILEYERTHNLDLLEDK